MEYTNEIVELNPTGAFSFVSDAEKFTNEYRSARSATKVFGVHLEIIYVAEVFIEDVEV